MAVRVNIPVRIRVDPEALSERRSTVDDALASAVGRALGHSREVVLAQQSAAPVVDVEPPVVRWSGDGLDRVGSQLRDELAQQIDATLANTAATAGLTAASGTAAAGSLRRRRRHRRRWFVRNAINFHVRVGDFLAFQQQMGSGGPSGLTDVYFDLLDEVRWVSGWMVQVNEPYRVGDLAEEVGQRAMALARASSEKSMYWAFSTDERHRQRLNAIDQDGVAESALPDMRRRNFGRVHGEGEDAILWPRGWMLFADIVLPSIELYDVAILGNEIQVRMRIRDLEFIVGPDSFRRSFDVSWENYVEEFGDAPAWLQILPVYPSRRAHFRTLNHFVHEHVAQQVESTAAYFGGLRLLNEETLGWLPDAAHAAATRLTDDVTRGLAPERRTDWWETGWTGAFVYAVLQPSEDELNRARYRPAARRTAARIAAELLHNRGFPWQFEFYGTLKATPRGLGFEYVLEYLEILGAFDRLFDAVDHADYWDLHEMLIRRCLDTRYASHRRVRQSIALINARRLERLQNAYIITDGVQEIRLLHRSDAAVRVGAANDRDVVGQVWPRFLHEEETSRIRPSREAEFERRMFEASRAMLAEILSGTDQNTYSEQAFAEAVLKRTVDGIGLEAFQEDWVEEVTVQLSARVLGVRRRDPTLELYEVTFELVRRYPGGRWESVPHSRTTVADGYFEEMLTWWRMVQGLEFMEKLGMVVTGVALFAIAAELGVVAFLVELAGGYVVVGVSITIAEVIYLVTAEHYSLEGFLLAALDGYLLALGFRFAGMAGRSLAVRIGTQSLPRLIGGWFAERLAVGTLGGAGSAGLITFSHDIINIALGRSSSLTSPEEYVRRMGHGALLGVVFEFGAAPLQPLLRVGGQTGLETIGQVVQRIRSAGISLPRWSALSAEALSGLRQRLEMLLEPGLAQRVQAAFVERVAQISESLSAEGRRVIWQGTIARRVLELSEINLSRAASEGLEKMLQASVRHLDDEAVLALSNNLRSSPARAARFLEEIGTLEEPVIGQVARARHLETLANAPELIERIRFDPTIRSMILRAESLTSAAAAERVGGLLEVVRSRPPVPETVTRGAFFAEGGTSQIFTVEGEPELLLKPGGGRTPREAEAMVEMELMGIPTALAATRHGDGTQIVLRRIDGVGSKDIHQFGQPVSTAQHVEVVTQRTLDDLERIYGILAANRANVGDFQFIIRGSDGAVFMNDPVSIVVGRSRPSGRIRGIIDNFRSIHRRASGSN